jgi:hypothetical protein
VIIAVPAITPVTIPVREPTVAIVVLLLDQVPPPVESLNMVVEPTHTDVSPVIIGGRLTVIVVVV